MEQQIMFLSIFSLAMFFVAWRRFKYAIGFLILALPAYVIRFQVGPLPTTFLEAVFGIVFLVWLLRYAREDVREIMTILKKDKLFFIFVAIFFVSSIIGVLVSDMVLLSLGQWRAYFLEPLILFFILLGRKKELSSKEIIWFLIFSTLSISVCSIVQKFTGWGISTLEWTRPETRRVTAFFLSPNAVGLFLGPTMILMLYVLMEKVSWFKKIFQQSLQHKKIVLAALFLLLSTATVLFTKSEGTVIALGAGVATVLFLIGFRKMVLSCIVIALIGCALVPPLRSAVLFQDKAGQNRITLWTYSWNFFTQSPKNFILGAGVRQFFRKIQKPHYDVKKMERLIYPHNIVFNFWSEVGFFGMISFMAMLGYAFYRAWRLLKTDRLWGATLIAILMVILVHGLVDVPYFKNDLAMLFWILMSLFFTSISFKKETAA